MEQIQFVYFEDYMQYYTVHHKENCMYTCGNLAPWMMVQAPPTTASLFWFYYSICFNDQLGLFLFNFLAINAYFSVLMKLANTTFPLRLTTFLIPLGRRAFVMLVLVWAMLFCTSLCTTTPSTMKR